MPTCWIIAGPNGAGKTTFALTYLPSISPTAQFINADLIAAGLSPLVPEREIMAASRLLRQKIETCIAERRDFACETTLAGRTYLRLIKRLKSTGWQVELLYLALPNLELSRSRVAERVAHGGHHIPDKDLVRRFPRSLHNLLQVYSHEVDHCTCFMNNSQEPIKVFQQSGTERVVYNQAFYQQILKESAHDQC